MQDHVGVPMIGIDVAIEAYPATILADGINTSGVVVAVVETTSRIPLEGEQVRFGASVGSIMGRSTVDETGSAGDVLTGSPRETSSQIKVFHGKTLTAEINVTFSALPLTLDTGSRSLVADGISSTEMTALLVNQ